MANSFIRAWRKTIQKKETWKWVWIQREFPQLMKKTVVETIFDHVHIPHFGCFVNIFVYIIQTESTDFPDRESIEQNMSNHIQMESSELFISFFALILFTSTLWKRHLIRSKHLKTRWHIETWRNQTSLVKDMHVNHKLSYEKSDRLLSKYVIFPETTLFARDWTIVYFHGPQRNTFHEKLLFFVTFLDFASFWRQQIDIE